MNLCIICCNIRICMSFLLWSHFLLSGVSQRITATWPTLKKLNAVWLSSAPGLQVCWMQIHQKYVHRRDDTTKALRNRTDGCSWSNLIVLAYGSGGPLRGKRFCHILKQDLSITLSSYHHYQYWHDLFCNFSILSWIDNPVNVCRSSGLCGRRRVAYLAPELPLQLRPLLVGLAADSLGFALVQETPSPRDVTKVSTLCHV